jgi:hypothetical protein
MGLANNEKLVLPFAVVVGVWPCMFCLLSSIKLGDEDIA